MRLELRKGQKVWGISVEGGVVTTWTDPAKPASKDHSAPWKAIQAADKEVRKKMLAGFFRLQSEGDDIVYDAAFARSAEVFDFHPSGASIAVAQIEDDARGAQIAVVDLTTGDRRTVVAFPGDAGQTFIQAVRFDASGERILVALNRDTLAVTVTSGALEHLTTPSVTMNGQMFEHASMLRSDHARKRFTAQDGDDLVVRDAERKVLIRRDARHASRGYHAVRLSPSGRLLVMQILGTESDTTNVIELWNVDEGKLVRTFDISKQSPKGPPYDHVEIALFVADEKSLLFTFVPGDRGFFSLPLDGASSCLDLTEKVWTYGAHLRDMALEGQTLAVAGQGDIRFFDWPSLTLRSTAAGDIARGLSIRFSDDGKLIASGNSWGRVVVRKSACTS